MQPFCTKQFIRLDSYKFLKILALRKSRGFTGEFCFFPHICISRGCITTRPEVYYGRDGSDAAERRIAVHPRVKHIACKRRLHRRPGPRSLIDRNAERERRRDVPPTLSHLPWPSRKPPIRILCINTSFCFLSLGEQLFDPGISYVCNNL